MLKGILKSKGRVLPLPHNPTSRIHNSSPSPSVCHKKWRTELPGINHSRRAQGQVKTSMPEGPPTRSQGPQTSSNKLCKTFETLTTNLYSSIFFSGCHPCHLHLLLGGQSCSFPVAFQVRQETCPVLEMLGHYDMRVKHTAQRLSPYSGANAIRYSHAIEIGVP